MIDKRLEKYIMIKPHRIFIDISAAGCGSGCSYCYVRTKNEPQQLLTTAQIGEICEYADSKRVNGINVVTLCPNTEPLKSEESINLINYICQYFILRDYYVQISTKEVIPKSFLDRLNTYADNRVFFNISIPYISDFELYEPKAAPVDRRIANFQLLSKYQNVNSCLYIKPFTPHVMLDQDKYINIINNYGISTSCVGVGFTTGRGSPCLSLYDPHEARKLFNQQSSLINEFITTLRNHTNAKIFSSSICCICDNLKSKCLLDLSEYNPVICADCSCKH